MLGGGEPGRWIGADFADDRRGAMPCDPRDRLVSSRWAQKGCIICSTCSSSVGSSSWSRWAGCNRHIRGVMIVEARLQRPLQIRDFRAHPALRLAPLRRRGRRSPSMSASTIARTDLMVIDDATESALMPGVLQHITQPLKLRAAMLDQLAAIADHIAGGLDLRGRTERLPAQIKAALEQIRQPLASERPVLRPGTFLTCRALHTSTCSNSPSASSA